MTLLDRLRNRLIVSCQPLADQPDDPMRDPGVQARIAAAVVLGGASGIRANGTADIAAVRAAVTVPLIGLIKDGTAGCVITPTAAHAERVVDAGADIVALDATARPRPDRRSVGDTIRVVHDRGALVLADVSTLEEGEAAVAAGADAVATTLSGYTGGPIPHEPDIDLVARLADRLPVPVLAEGRYRKAEQITGAFEAGAHAVVVGNAVTSPLWITRSLLAGAAQAPR
ncbi:N-acetylmannosamine-6-phosphate 2-epimerase [Dactylosporangium fulvum]|uniref:N-acylglucosamine-6-phosphate 2-epimerase n=1 Tax=Dactylosporangium fulvum TaxID=53359 RepID=A0ABY5W5T9_9ACTN|nr:putative N-acetylmannosamine-6-phosphate 2-epimerase [Dactylosporangium fulvum]UWP84389.1 putative N-acetylmannosamine-6-phosphate 2-epimerase [Dactylosporangium fulvum]